MPAAIEAYQGHAAAGAPAPAVILHKAGPARQTGIASRPGGPGARPGQLAAQPCGAAAALTQRLLREPLQTLRAAAADVIAAALAPREGPSNAGGPGNPNGSGRTCVVQVQGAHLHRSQPLLCEGQAHLAHVPA